MLNLKAEPASTRKRTTNSMRYDPFDTLYADTMTTNGLEMAVLYFKSVVVWTKEFSRS